MASAPIHSLDVLSGVVVRSVWEKEKRHVWQQMVSVSAAIVFHAFLFAILYTLPKKQSVENGGMGTPVQVRVAEKAESSGGKPSPAVLPRQVPKNDRKPSHALKSTTAPLVPVLKEDASAEPRMESQPPREEAAVPETALSRYLPSAHSEFAENQRRVGAQGRLGDESQEDVLPEGGARALRPNVVTTQFSTLAYRLELERRFSDAWGGVRVLPPYSRFSGRTGELIVYNVVINRDGTLRRIVNLSALEQSERDFLAVDLLVQDFANSVFPMNPIPARVREDPFVVRWSIRFMGFQYSFF